MPADRRSRLILVPALLAGALLVACGSSGRTGGPTPTPGKQSTPVGVAFASGAGSDSLEGAVPAGPIPVPSSPPPALALPVQAPYELGEPFGVPRLGGRIHGGLDFELQGSLDVLAACSGTVVAAGPTDAYDLAVQVDCGNGWSTLSGYLESVSVSNGQRVEQGGTIGAAPAGNPAIHFEIRWQNAPLDPQAYLDFSGAPPETPASSTPPAIPGQPHLTAPPTQPPSPVETPGNDPTATLTALPVTATSTRPAPTSTPEPPTATATATPRRANPTPTRAPVLR